MSDCSAEQTLLPQPAATIAPQRAPSAGPFAVIDQLLRDRKGLLERIESGEDLVGLARTMILTIAASAVVFGVSLGLYRGGVQIAYAAIKLPLVVLLTAALTTPALSALRHVIEGQADVRRDLALVLSSLALGSLVIAALAPVIMLAVSWGVGYHSLILLTVGCCAIGGVTGLSLFFRGTAEIPLGARALIVTLTLLLVAMVGAQMTWTLRPYLVRPRTVEVPMIRSLEGSFLDAVTTSGSSAMGVYSREAAPLPEQFGGGEEWQER